jgi:acyl-CoA synthetase (AMP-forming)/AMP-acid ligase II
MRWPSTRGADASKIAAYFHTGGTTGAPKLAQQTRANQAAMAWMLCVTPSIWVPTMSC